MTRQNTVDSVKVKNLVVKNDRKYDCVFTPNSMNTLICKGRERFGLLEVTQEPLNQVG